ncbi:hypothetical protein DSBG_1732 [Desulfosporosinus sp. BG]|nr:hypothetical protein DSBG_1732 [Desulfosporosinus sp. BG]
MCGAPAKFLYLNYGLSLLNKIGIINIIFFFINTKIKKGNLGEWRNYKLLIGLINHTNISQSKAEIE